MRLVTKAQFKRLRCNRCGECCQRFSLGGRSPLQLVSEIGRLYEPLPGAIDMDVWLAHLVPTQHPDGAWTYACLFYQPANRRRKPACTIHDRRPTPCRDFPYGQPTPDYKNCSWYVQV